MYCSLHGPHLNQEVGQLRIIFFIDVQINEGDFALSAPYQTWINANNRLNIEEGATTTTFYSSRNEPYGWLAAAYGVVNYTRHFSDLDLCRNIS